MITSLVMRIQLLWPAPHFVASPDAYASLTLVHGSLMVFVVLTCAPQAGFGTYFLPTQIGAERNGVSPPHAPWILAYRRFVVIGMVVAFFCRAGNRPHVWLFSVAAFCVGAALNALNFVVTTTDSRAKGMTLPRLPVTVWAWFITAVLSLLIFSMLFAACVLLLAIGLHATHFFALVHHIASPIVSLAATLLVLHPGASLRGDLPVLRYRHASHRDIRAKPVFAHRGVVLALCGVGLCGFWIWGEHAFAVGLNPYAPLVFSMLALSLGIPASILLISWFGTLWNAKPRFSTAMLFALAFISLFVTGGLTGLLLARAKFPDTSAGDALVSGHYHLVMGIAATFAMLAALFFWFPKMFGHALSERLGKIHFWLTFAGVYLLFIPMHWLGMISHFRIRAGDAAARFAARLFSSASRSPP